MEAYTTTSETLLIIISPLFLLFSALFFPSLGQIPFEFLDDDEQTSSLL
jgi:hypothetical protein